MENPGITVGNDEIVSLNDTIIDICILSSEHSAGSSSRLKTCGFSIASAGIFGRWRIGISGPWQFPP